MDATVQPRLHAGDLVAGRFRVVRQLGEGGAAAAYEVCDERSGRRLALKRLQHAASPTRSASVALFEREYHTLRQLAHPRIIAAYDYGFDQGAPFYTMELLDGADMQTLGVQPWRKACALLCDVASSLAIVHSRRLVHRDVSARNVRCTADGRAKLFDFGALSPMGVAKHIVGTPPYAAPEALERQGLDGRADLYSLGALAYWLLCGYHAYHARSFGQLRVVWRSPPLPPSQDQPEVPPDLDQLVLQLLQLERSGRPTAAAEVMERLSGIAGLPLSELPEVRRSYLVMPSLVGREAQLERIRERLQRVGAEPHGAVVSIDGVSGAGRSRVLEACMLEAKLRGMTVLHGDAAEGGSAEYGLVRALCGQLWQELPELCERAAQGREQLLAQVMPPLATQVPQGASGEADAPAPTAERSKLQAALRTFLLAICRDRPLVIGVDDIEAVDEPSAALLGLLAHAAQRAPLVLIVSTNRDAESTPASTLIQKLAMAVPLAPLPAEQTEALLRSVFGDVEYGSALSSRVHGLAQGNPRWTMMLAEHVVERGLARYEAGAWILSHDVHAHDLPATMRAALADRIASLGADARELADALSLTEPSKIAVDGYALLPAHSDHARTYRALDQLVERGVLIAEGEHYRFSQPELSALLSSMLAPERARQLHARIAGAMAGSDDRLLCVHHMLLGDLPRQALQALPDRLSVRDYDLQMCSKRTLDVLQRALAAAESLEVAPELQLRLQGHIVAFAAMCGDLPSFTAYAPRLLDRLSVACGLPSGQADGGCSTRAAPAEEGWQPQVQYGTAPPPELLPPRQAAALLGRVCGAATTMANIAMSYELLDALPELQGLAPHAPVLSIAHALVQASRSLLAGTFGFAHEHTLQVLELLQQIDPSDMDPSYVEYLRLAMHYKLALFAASAGASRAGEWLAELHLRPGIRANAARVRMVQDLMQGNIEAATARRQRAELLSVQDGELLVFPGTTARIELLAFVLADNLLGVKRAIERIEPIAVLYPGWGTTLSIARAHYRRLSGDLAGALDALKPALNAAVIGRHMDWSWAAGTHLLLLSALARHAEAFECALRYREMNRRYALALSHPVLTSPLCEALANGGKLEQAATMIQSAIDDYRQFGARGLVPGMLYETAARIALKRRDREAFTRFVRLCAKEYRGGSNALREARFARLLQEADEQELCPASDLLGHSA